MCFFLCVSVSVSIKKTTQNTQDWSGQVHFKLGWHLSLWTLKLWHELFLSWGSNFTCVWKNYNVGLGQITNTIMIVCFQAQACSCLLLRDGSDLVVKRRIDPIKAWQNEKTLAFIVVVLTGTFQLVVLYVGAIYSRYSSSQPQIPKIHLIAYFTSADACLGDEFENYCFIKSISSLEEAYVWGRICIDRSLTLTSRQCLPPSLSSPQLDTRRPKFWLPGSWPGCLRECMQMATAHHEHFAQRWARRVRRPSSCFDWGSSFVLEVSQLMRDCSGDKDTTTQNEPKKKPIFKMVWFLQLLLYPVEINFRMTYWSNTLRILTELDSVLLFLHVDLIPLVFLITLPFPQTSGVLTSPVKCACF